MLIALGRVQSVRTAGNKLVFLDLKQGDFSLQAICQLNRLGDRSEAGFVEFKNFAKTVRKGDWYEIRGHPHRTARGELSILGIAVPTLLSPSLHQIPDVLEDAETRARSRHVDMLVNPESVQTLKVRSHVEQALNDFFRNDEFVKVTTPILASQAGGAVARSFETEATELNGLKLNLRIAPELWLKRLSVGGLEKVYEIGPAFRNEGVDATHNPEFYTCEFYQAFATLDDLMAKTEDLLGLISDSIEAARSTHFPNLTPTNTSFKTPFQRLDFIPTLQQQLNITLPDLTQPSAQETLLEIFASTNHSPPSNPTLPRLLDALASHYIEPLCTSPTFITQHPLALSPLARHFTCPTTGQIISARAELFIAGREYANMYEEENSPFAQREKFEAQLAGRGAEGGKGIDESYLEALEWGLPPTGGWGIGIERLVMLFAGRERMADVLSFGSLRNVVGLARRRRTTE